MPSQPSPQVSPHECAYCGTRVTQRIGGVPICDNCYAIRGSCCHETEEDTGFASPPCYAHLFEEEDAVDEFKPGADNSEPNHRRH